MKSNTSPSDPLNLCAPVGVTGTTLPASPVKDTPAESKHAVCMECGHYMEIDSSGVSFHTDGSGEPDHEQDADHVAIADAPASPVDSVGVPADPDDMNERRSKWAENAIRKFMGESLTDRGDALSDLLSNFGHWADRNDTSLEAEIQRAAMHYNDETDSEGTQFSFLDASHAAKDAKIKALEEALDGLLDAIHADAVSFPSSPKAVSTARAALTLPCA